MKNNNKNNRELLMGKEAEKWEEFLWDNLLNKLSEIKSKNILKENLENLLSESERKIILRRIATMALIKQGKSYQEIGEILWVSPATISAIKKNIFSKNGPHKSHRTVYGRKQKFVSIKHEESFSENFIELISYLAEGLAKAFLSRGIGITGQANLYQNFNRNKKQEK